MSRYPSFELELADALEEMRQEAVDSHIEWMWEEQYGPRPYWMGEEDIDPYWPHLEGEE